MKKTSKQNTALPGCSTRKQMLSEEVAACALNPVIPRNLSWRLFGFSLQVKVRAVCGCLSVCLLLKSTVVSWSYVYAAGAAME